MAALLVRVAVSDESYDAVERDTIDVVLAERFDLSPQDAKELRGEGETLERDAPDTVRFTRVLKDAVPFEDRSTLAVALWRVALADGERAAEENALLRQVVNLLGISDMESNTARQQAMKAT
ncbi:MAG: TerB family tellurite resistance protein [Pseudomonadota bacterium]